MRHPVKPDERVRLVDKRRYEPEPRELLGEHGGERWRGFRFAWRLRDEDRGWLADCEWVQRHPGEGNYRQMLPPQRVQLPESAKDAGQPTDR